jgi:hypothetical protein
LNLTLDWEVTFTSRPLYLEQKAQIINNNNNNDFKIRTYMRIYFIKV